MEKTIKKPETKKPVVKKVTEEIKKEPEVKQNKAIAFVRELDGNYFEPVIKVNFGGREWIIVGEPFINSSIVKEKTEALADVLNLKLVWKD